MRHIKHITITILLLVIPFITVAQENQDMLIGSYPYEMDTVSTEIERVMEKGYLPVGLEVNPGKEITILYSRSEHFEASRYLLFEFDDAETFEAEFTEHIKNGWLPMDISFVGSSVFGLFVPSPFKINGWRVTSTDFDSDDISTSLTDFKEKGFFPWGISGVSDKLWFLLLDIEEQNYEQSFVDFYTTTDQEVEAAIESEMKSGWTPWGLMKRDKALSIVYVR
ncbi:MAG: hypothetical protein ACOC2R_04250 [Spirochaetota bacterium]